MQIRKRIIFAAVFECCFSSLLLAVTIPSRKNLAEQKKNMPIQPVFDENFDRWLKLMINQPEKLEDSKADVTKYLKDKDEVFRFAFLIAWERRHNKVVDQETLLSAVRVVEDHIAATLVKPAPAKPVAKPPMLPDLITMILQEDSVSLEQQRKFETFLMQLPVSACSTKEWFLDKLTTAKSNRFSDDDITKIIRVLEDYESTNSLKRGLEIILESSTTEQIKKFAKEFSTLAQKVPKFYSRFPDLQTDKIRQSNPMLNFSNIETQIRNNQCTEAWKSFAGGIDSLAPNSKNSQTDQYVEIGREIDKCFGGTRRTETRENWAQAEKSWQKAFGNRGSLLVKIRLGYLDWIMNKVDEAEKAFLELYANRAQTNLLPADEAKLLFVLGRIADSKMNFSQAATYLQEYVERFDREEDFEVALTTLITARSSLKDFKNLEGTLDTFVKKQSLLDPLERVVGYNSLSLFWLGRAFLENGKTDLALATWKKLAGEYYSTYYGAMGHFMFEKVSRKPFLMEPVRTPSFRDEELFSKLDSRNLFHATRAQQFLKMGATSSAKCEIREIRSSTTDYQKTLIKAVLQYASGSWLDAVRSFDSIPRYFRNSLPIGFERILFPQNYAEMVVKYSRKLNLDSDFVFALIRQESVFDPSARSLVGATGLMQLMPETAQLEASKLSGNYVTAEVKRKLIKMTKLRRNLEDPELNIILGVHHIHRLLSMYRSPVLALSAYNAGPVASERWRRTISTDDYLTFIERIPYKETRGYVKLILRNYFYYRRWYGTPTLKDAQPLEFVTSQLLTSIQKTTRPGKKLNN